MKVNKLIIYGLVMLGVLFGTVAVAWKLTVAPFDSSDYVKVLKRLKDEGYVFVLPKDFSNFSNQVANKLLDRKIAILRHDVDANTRGLGTFTDIELEFKVRSAFYVRPDAEYFSHSINRFKYLEVDGWEIGFHYDCLSQSYGNESFAERLFLAQLDYLNVFFKIYTTTAHGDLFNLKINNANMVEWIEYSTLKDFTVVKNATYVSDAGHTPLVLPEKLNRIVLINAHTDWW